MNLKKKKINEKLDKSNPNDIKLLRIINKKKDGRETEWVFAFDFIQTFDNFYYLIYINNFGSIVFYDLLINTKVIQIKGSHYGSNIYISHYSDNINKRDLFISYYDDIKLWNIQKMECLFVIDNSWGNDNILSGLFFLNMKKECYITTSFRYNNNYEKINLYDLNGKLKKQIKFKNKNALFDVKSYYDKKLKKSYIIFCGPGIVKSFDMDKDSIYKIYCNEEKGCTNNQIIIYDFDSKVKVISCALNMIRIWNFHKGDLLNVIKKNNIEKICIWNADYLFAACRTYGLKLIDLKTGSIIQSLTEFKYSTDVKKIKHPIYGECLLSLNGYTGYLLLGIKKNF